LVDKPPVVVTFPLIEEKVGLSPKANLYNEVADVRGEINLCVAGFVAISGRAILRVVGIEGSLPYQPIAFGDLALCRKKCGKKQKTSKKNFHDGRVTK